MLLEILKMWASEIDDESIVIDDSGKDDFYSFM